MFLNAKNKLGMSIGRMYFVQRSVIIVKNHHCDLNFQFSSKKTFVILTLTVIDILKPSL